MRGALTTMVAAGIAFFCFIFVGVIALLAVVMPLMYRAFARGTGYAELARRFPAMTVPAGTRYDWQNVRIGAVRWRFSATLIFAPEGLYLALMSRMPVLGSPGFNQHPPVLIPWGEMKSARPAMLYWRRAVTITVGEPSLAAITLYEPFFPLVQHYTGLPPLA